MRAPVAIAATGPVSLAAARQVARAGGNAVDVAVAAGLAAMSTEPGIVSLAGGAFVAAWVAGGEPVVIDGNVEMPGRGLGLDRFGSGVREVVTDYGGGVRLHAGHGSVATPGAVTACEAAVEELGLLPWRDVVAPAAAACRDGYPIGGAAARYLAFTAEPLFGDDPEAHGVVTRPDGSPLEAGDVVTNQPLAEVLDLVAEKGASVLTTGQVGRAMVESMEAHGGLVTHRDLAEYTALLREPVRRRVGDWDLAVNPPPSVGGPMLAAMLGELGRRGDWHWPDIIEIQRAVLSYRLQVHDFAEDLDAAGHELLLSVDRHGLAGLPTSSSTANVSVVDAEGTACAVTMSSGYGAGITVPGTGMLLNNALGEPELQQARPPPAGPRHPARIQHGAHDGAHRRRPGACHRLSGRRPDHDRAHARAGSRLSPWRRPPARDRSTTTPRPFRPGRLDGRRPRDRPGHRERGRRGRGTRYRPRHPADVLRRRRGGIPARRRVAGSRR